ncbi:DUF4747 family protein [uncultured Brevundimonas sp.]|uniref:DUF4747 family protein n=1 Tax=uncultured Brevundimonas sp. TaxID=213418 RepID=UPI0025F2909A|nr:DUF4747 family protein [uncultured Brevundimonas sp.]
MARELKIAVGALNVRLHPHSPEIYDAFLAALYALRRPVRIRGDRFGMITILDRRSIDDGIIRGVLRTFTKIDPKARWFDQESMDDANAELLKQINIPVGVHPNSSAFRFTMNVRKHILTFEQYSEGRQLTPKSACAVFKGLAEDAAIVALFGPAKISILQDRQSLDRIFKLKRLKVITFIIDRPNPDIWSDDLEGEVDAHLAAAHAQRIAVTYEAPPGGSLVETPSLRRLGEGALRNGEIKARGYDTDGHVNVSTLDTPRIEQTKYDPEAESEQAAFERLRRGMEANQQ